MTDTKPGRVPRDVYAALRRGWSGRCPGCGKGRLYSRYLKVVEACPACGEEMHHHRADDAPPYFTMLVVGHIVVALVLVVAREYRLEPWVHAVLWGPLILLLSLYLLPRFKGALIGYQWALRMHGFGTAPDPAAPEPWPPTAPGRTNV